MFIINAEGIVQKGAMAAKVNRIIAILQGALFFFFFYLGCWWWWLLFEIEQVSGVPHNVPRNDHNTIYIGQKMTPSQKSLCVFSCQ